MICDKNCFACPYTDCICEDSNYSDIEDVDRELDREIGYLKACYNGTLRAYKYNHSDKCKASQRKYAQSEKGKARDRRKTQKRIASGKNAEACRRYYQKKKAMRLIGT